MIPFTPREGGGVLRYIAVSKKKVKGSCAFRYPKHRFSRKSVYFSRN